MVHSEKEFNKRARHLLRMISDNTNISELSDEDKEILAECISLGYLNSKYMVQTQDGKHHFELRDNFPITSKGLTFLKPRRDWKFIIPSVIAVIELMVIIIQTIQNAKC